jgi:hypothetical protein
MTRYIQGSDRSQVTLLPECLDDYIDEDNGIGTLFDERPASRQYKNQPALSGLQHATGHEYSRNHRNAQCNETDEGLTPLYSFIYQSRITQKGVPNATDPTLRHANSKCGRNMAVPLQSMRHGNFEVCVSAGRNLLLPDTVAA